MTDRKTLGYTPCDNPEHDWHDKLCLTCHVPVKQYEGDEAVKKLKEIQDLLD